MAQQGPHLTQLIRRTDHLCFNCSSNVRKQSSPIQNQPQSQKPVITQYQKPERPKTLDAQSTNVDKTTNSKNLPFNEQEEWKKITEIMANFGTDSHILQEFNDSNSHRSHDRSENGRSNSIAGFDTTQVDRQWNAMKKMDSMKGKIQRKPGAQSPRSKLIYFLYEHQIEELADTLNDNGYDAIEFVKGILDESDLDAMEIKPELRVKLMKAIDSGLQTPPRTVTPSTKSHTNAVIIFNNTLGTNDDELHQNNRNTIVGTFENNSNGNNNNHSTMPKQTNHNNQEANGSLSVNDWLNDIRLPQYAEVFRQVTISYLCFIL